MAATELTVSTGSESYKFGVLKDALENDTYIYLVGKGPTCMAVDVYTKQNTAYISTLSYYPECSIGKKLRSGTGTIMMVKGVLKYILQEHPNIQRVDIVDTAYKHLKKHKKEVQITPRMILLGNPGWYEDHFGAQPTPRTFEVIQRVAKKAGLDEVKPEWGSFIDLEEHMSKHRIAAGDMQNIFNSHWFILPATIQAYSIAIESRPRQVGGMNRNKMEKRLYDVDRLIRNHHAIHRTMGLTRLT